MPTNFLTYPRRRDRVPGYIPGVTPHTWQIPTDIANLAVWLKADNGTGGVSDGDAVTTWTDQSGNSNSPTQGTAANKPLYKTNIKNGLPVVRFDGSNDFLKKAFTLNVPITYFVVYKFVSYIFDARAWDGNGNDSNMLATETSTEGWFFSGVYLSKGVPNDITNFRLLTITLNGASSAIRCNGVSIPVAGTASGNPGGLTLGARASGGSCNNVDIAEFVIYTGALALASITPIENYLNYKWAVY